MTEIELRKLLYQVIDKAMQDNIITQDEKALIETIKIEIENTEDKIKEITEDIETKSVLSRIMTTAGRQMLQSVVSKAREDGSMTSDENAIIHSLIDALDLDMDLIRSRPWYVFKICVKIESTSNVDSLLDNLDKILCLRGLDPTHVYSGLCLGTKHYVTENIDVTMLIFAITPDITHEWVTKGAFAILEYDNRDFGQVLRHTAESLLQSSLN